MWIWFSGVAVAEYPASPISCVVRSVLLALSAAGRTQLVSDRPSQPGHLNRLPIPARTNKFWTSFLPYCLRYYNYPRPSIVLIDYVVLMQPLAGFYEINHTFVHLTTSQYSFRLCKWTEYGRLSQQQLGLGPHPEFGFGGGQVEGLQAPRVYVAGYGEWVSPPQKKNKKIIFGSRNAYFVAFFYGPSECLLLHCNMSRPRPPARLPSWYSTLTVAQSKVLDSRRRRHWTLSSLVVNTWPI